MGIFLRKHHSCDEQGSIRNIFLGSAKKDSPIAIRSFRGEQIMKAGRNTSDAIGLPMHWVLISKLADYTGYTDDAIRAKKQRGEWKEGIHWRKGPDNRLIFNLVTIQHWMGGCDA